MGYPLRRLASIAADGRVTCRSWSSTDVVLFETATRAFRDRAAGVAHDGSPSSVTSRWPLACPLSRRHGTRTVPTLRPQGRRRRLARRGDLDPARGDLREPAGRSSHLPGVLRRLGAAAALGGIDPSECRPRSALRRVRRSADEGGPALPRRDVGEVDVDALGSDDDQDAVRDRPLGVPCRGGGPRDRGRPDGGRRPAEATQGRGRDANPDGRASRPDASGPVTSPARSTPQPGSTR